MDSETSPMQIRRVRGILALAVLAAGAVMAADTSKSTPTFSKDVAPILYNNCTTCHRPGEIAPMSLLDYKAARPWAKSIKQAVASRVMPPWFADPAVGHWANDTRLKLEDVDTIVKWVDAGAPEGNSADLPPAPKYVKGWVMGKPDMVVEMAEAYQLPANGVIPYQYITVDPKLTEDKWVRGVEIRAGNRQVVHHIIVGVQDPGARANFLGIGVGNGAQLGGTAPGLQPKFYPEGVAKQLKAGSKLVFQMHYTPNGKATSDKSYIGLYFSKQPPTKIARGAVAVNLLFKIPPGDPNYEVKSQWTAPADVVLTNFTPHMHLRGKDFKYTAYFPDGHSEVLLNVPHYDFNWQLRYEAADPIHIPKGTRIECVAHYDNSTNNKFNPDPEKMVRWGDQTFEEMMVGFLEWMPDRQRASVSGPLEQE
jgi:hypothetical protein